MSTGKGKARHPRHRMPARLQGGGSLSNPSGGAAATPVSGSEASPGGTPMIMPLQQVTVQPTSSQYCTIGSSEYTPIYDPTGETIPGTAPGRWDQLRQAGRP
jgi:hypothetical protein